MKKVRRYKISSLDDAFTLKLIKTRQHLRNLIVLISEDESLSPKSKSIMRNSKSFAYLVRKSFHGKPNEEDFTKLLEEIYQSEKLTSLFNEIETLFTVFSSKFLLQVVKEVETSYKSAFTKIKQKLISSFSMKTKRLSRVRSGTIVFDSNIVRYRDGEIILNVFNSKYTKNNTIRVYVGDEDFLSNVSTANCSIVRNQFGEVELLLTYEDGFISHTKEDNGNYISIDPGLNNHLSIYLNSGDVHKSWLIRNRAINRVNNECFRILPKVSSKLDEMRNANDFSSKYRHLKNVKTALINKRQRVIRNELHKITNRILEACSTYSVNTIILGFNKGQKNGVNMGRNKNKEFMAIPHALLQSMLAYKCKEFGINFVLQEESYTSKLSCVSDSVWKYEKGKRETNESNGIRGITVGGKKITSLFKDKLYKVTFHADINGAVNILQKYLKCAVPQYISVLASPKLIRDDFDFIKELR